MKFDKLNNVCWNVVSPSYRFDLSVEEDLIEEVARLYGYENIPAKFHVFQTSEREISKDHLTINNEVKSTLFNRGYYETINYSFIDPELDKIFSSNTAISLENPISQNLSVMRQSLIPGLFSSFKRNLNRQQSRIRIFEEGVCFQKYQENEVKQKDIPYYELLKIAGLAYGYSIPTNWKEKSISDFYSVKSDVESLLKLTKREYHFSTCDNLSWLHPGQSAYICHENQKIGVIGALHPNIIKQIKVRSKLPIVFELSLPQIDSKILPNCVYPSKFPSVSRDITFVIDCKQSVQSLLDCLKKIDIIALSDTEIIDLYEGKNIGVGKKSVTLNLIFQLNDQTLTDQQIDTWMSQVVNQVKSNVKAEIRS
jgi:phenylalanyl-tRNA synthetase beta chain